jgi:hypothetical protein
MAEKILLAKHFSQVRARIVAELDRESMINYEGQTIVEGASMNINLV